MKRMMKNIYSCMFAFALVCAGFLVNFKNANAASPIEKNEEYKYTEGALGSVTVTDKGSVIVEYKYGIPEIVIQVQRCADYRDGDTQTITDGSIEDAEYCNQFSNEITIIHVSGDLNENPTKGNETKTVHLFKKGFTYYEILNIQVQTAFFASEAVPTMIHCNKEMSGATCQDYDKNTQIGGIAYKSIQNRYGKNVKAEMDKDQIIYQYPGESGAAPSNKWLDLKWYNSKGEVGSSYTSMCVRVDNSDFSTLVIDEMIYDDIIPLLIGVLVIAAGVSLAVLGYQIVKSADEDQERHDKIKRLRNILIGLGIAILLLFVIEPLSKVVERFLQ